MTRPAHPGRGTTTLPTGALAAARRPAELSLTDTCDLLAAEPVQTEDGPRVTTVFPVVTAGVPCRAEPEDRSVATITVGGDPSYLERWIVEIPHGTAVTVDQHIHITGSTNPRLIGTRLRVTGELDSSTEPLRRLAAAFLSTGEG